MKLFLITYCTGLDEGRKFRVVAKDLASALTIFLEHPHPRWVIPSKVEEVCPVEAIGAEKEFDET